ncbi:hypothetical protein HCN44_007822 [Aphidius gifuensis]|uniref:Cytochrome P450 n=1 Tax=Aphidius gifuensis TaxID=684658 RepID=A0A835CQJ1_APHGI|nr:hypothetical protein HCN44_007822 [Aphidius gifuensis]
MREISQVTHLQTPNCNQASRVIFQTKSTNRRLMSNVLSAQEHYKTMGLYGEVILYDEVINLAPEGCDLVAENLRGAKYLRACITEGFRMLPTAPCIARLLDAPIELSDYQLEEGTVVLLHTWIAGLNDDNFYIGKKWMPDRWIKSLLPHSPLLVAPFGAGRRICPGKRFVEQVCRHYNSSLPK